jgi:prophage antirepressor-like protein
MNSEIIPYIYEDKPVRIILDDQNNPWWVAQDVCNILGILNGRQAVNALDDDEHNTVCLTGSRLAASTMAGTVSILVDDNNVTFDNSIPSRAGNPNVNVINEPGLYTLIIRSDKPAARIFRRWITHELIPSLRKKGHYDVAERGNNPKCPPPETQVIPDHVLEKIRNSGKHIRLSNRVQLLNLACQMNRIDRETVPTRESILNDYVALCDNISVTEKTLRHEKGMDVIDDFIDERCFREPGAKVKASVIYDRFVDWYRENVGPTLHTSTWFGRNLKEKFNKRKSNGCVYYFGIGLKKEKVE